MNIIIYGSQYGTTKNMQMNLQKEQALKWKVINI